MTPGSADKRTANTADVRPALFLDRDGVINVDKDYLYRIEDVEWIDGVVDCLKTFRSRGYRIFIVTNQSGIARNFYTEAEMQALHDWMRTQWRQAGTDVDAVYHCPFHEEGENPAYRQVSDDRKPRPGMLLRAMAAFPTDKSLSFMIGDKLSDVQAAENAGIRGFLFDGVNLNDFAKAAAAEVAIEAQSAS